MAASPYLVTLSQDNFFIPDLCGGRAVFVLVLVSELCVFAMVLAASGIQAFSWSQLSLVSLFVQWVVLSSAFLLCTFRRRLAVLSLPLAVSVAYTIVLLVTLLLTLIAGWVLSGAYGSVDAAALARNLIISAIMTGLVLRYFYVQSRLRSQEQAELQARIQALQSRIRPHFLFNSMNSIASLIRSAPDAAEQAIEDLAELFRASLKEADQPVRLEQEIELCKRYIGIEQLRLGARLRVQWDIDQAACPAPIPMLMLQPLLENAIYHGIQPLPEGGNIAVVIERQEDKINITISNPTGGGESVKTEGNHIALENIRDRLAAFYGTDATLSTHVAKEIFVTQIIYPAQRVES